MQKEISWGFQVLKAYGKGFATFKHVSGIVFRNLHKAVLHPRKAYTRCLRLDNRNQIRSIYSLLNTLEPTIISSFEILYSKKMPINVVGHLQASSKENRDLVNIQTHNSHSTQTENKNLQLVKILLDIAKYSHESEPDTTQYVVAISNDPTNESDIYIIEEYATQEAFELVHKTSKHFENLLALFISKPELLAVPLEVPVLNPQHTISIKPTINDAKDLLIVVAYLSYNPGAIDEAVDGWSKVVKQSEGEWFTYMYNCSLDQDVKDRIWMLEVYAGQKGMDDHCKGDALVNKMKDEPSKWKANPTVQFLKIVGGYWFREEKQKL
jgi:quinol monooxygenase YgiN